MTGAADTRTFPELAEGGTVHLIGMGGAGMSALAELLLRRGVAVTGCDRQGSAALDRLHGLGATVSIGHDPAHLDGVDAVVYSPAVPADAPELTAARTAGVPLLKRSRALGEWVNRATVVAVGGTHGKTSTSALLAEVLREGGLEPTALVGGRVLDWGGNLLLGGDELYVVEADEFDRSFHTLRPRAAVVTNLEPDHLDIYGDFEGVRDAFRGFVGSVPADGMVFLSADDPGAGSLVGALGDRVRTFGLSAGSQLRGEIVDEGAHSIRFRPVEDGREVDPVLLAHPGAHSVRNALAAAAVARWMGVAWGPIRSALEAHRGVTRRYEERGVHRGVVIVDDYAHHPTEIAATLEAARGGAPGHRLVAVFQPHLFTRTRDFAEGFGTALAAADRVWVTGIYPAREEPIPGVDGRLVARAVERAGHPDVRYEEGLEALAERLAETLEEGDVCVIMGAGSIDRLPAALEALLDGAEVARA